MNELWSGAVGLLLGGIFFAGLCWTVRKALHAKQPALWFVGSFAVRMALVLSGFYWLVNHAWQNLLAALLGFVLARWLVLRLTEETTIHAHQP